MKTNLASEEDSPLSAHPSVQQKEMDEPDKKKPKIYDDVIVIDDDDDDDVADLDAKTKNNAGECDFLKISFSADHVRPMMSSCVDSEETKNSSQNIQRTSVIPGKICMLSNEQSSDSSHDNDKESKMDDEYLSENEYMFDENMYCILGKIVSLDENEDPNTESHSLPQPEAKEEIEHKEISAPSTQTIANNTFDQNIQSSSPSLCESQKVSNMENHPNLTTLLDAETQKGIPNVQYQCLCPICKRGCNSSVEYNEHMKKHLSQKESLNGIGTPSSNTFTEDKTALPNSEMFPLHCETCSNRFMHSWQLDRHMRSHSRFAVDKKILPFQCHYCNKRLKTHKNLNDHFRQYHSSAKVTCEICKKSVLEANYNKHLALHLAPSLQCPFCKISYKRQNHLNAHLLKMHPDKSTGNPDEITKALLENSTQFSMEELKGFTESERVTAFKCFLILKRKMADVKIPTSLDNPIDTPKDTSSTWSAQHPTDSDENICTTLSNSTEHKNVPVPTDDIPSPVPTKEDSDIVVWNGSTCTIVSLDGLAEKKKEKVFESPAQSPAEQSKVSIGNANLYSHPSPTDQTKESVWNCIMSASNTQKLPKHETNIVALNNNRLALRTNTAQNTIETSFQNTPSHTISEKNINADVCKDNTTFKQMSTTEKSNEAAYKCPVPTDAPFPNPEHKTSTGAFNDNTPPPRMNPSQNTNEMTWNGSESAPVSLSTPGLSMNGGDYIANTPSGRMSVTQNTNSALPNTTPVTTSHTTSKQSTFAEINNDHVTFQRMNTTEKTNGTAWRDPVPADVSFPNPVDKTTAGVYNTSKYSSPISALQNTFGMAWNHAGPASASVPTPKHKATAGNSTDYMTSHQMSASKKSNGAASYGAIPATGSYPTSGQRKSAGDGCYNSTPRQVNFSPNANGTSGNCNGPATASHTNTGLHMYAGVWNGYATSEPMGVTEKSNETAPFGTVPADAMFPNLQQKTNAKVGYDNKSAPHKDTLQHTNGIAWNSTAPAPCTIPIQESSVGHNTPSRRMSGSQNTYKKSRRSAIQKGTSRNITNSGIGSDNTTPQQMSTIENSYGNASYGAIPACCTTGVCTARVPFLFTTPEQMSSAGTYNDNTPTRQISASQKTNRISQKTSKLNTNIGVYNDNRTSQQMSTTDNSSRTDWSNAVPSTAAFTTPEQQKTSTEYWKNNIPSHRISLSEKMNGTVVSITVDAPLPQTKLPNEPNGTVGNYGLYAPFGNNKNYYMYPIGPANVTSSNVKSSAEQKNSSVMDSVNIHPNYFVYNNKGHWNYPTPVSTSSTGSAEQTRYFCTSTSVTNSYTQIHPSASNNSVMYSPETSPAQVMYSPYCNSGISTNLESSAEPTYLPVPNGTSATQNNLVDQSYRAISNYNTTKGYPLARNAAEQANAANWNYGMPTPVTSPSDQLHTVASSSGEQFPENSEYISFSLSVPNLALYNEITPSIYKNYQY